MNYGLHINTLHKQGEKIIVAIITYFTHEKYYSHYI